MKTNLFYFSGTGNSLAVAQDLANELKNTEIYSIPKVIDGKIDTKADAIGIIFPVYMFGVPLIVKRFIEKLNTKAYVFAIATCGGMPAGALVIAKKLLKKQGIELKAGYVLKMPGNYTPMYGPPAHEKQKKMFEIAKEKIKKISEVIKLKKNGKIEKNFFLINSLFTNIMYNAASKRIPTFDKEFWADKNCNGCKTCEKVCPVKNIKMVNKKPEWHNNCEQCFACLHWCPKEAIQFGKKTISRKRYHHPDVELKDMMK